MKTRELSVERICNGFGSHRDAYYKYNRRLKDTNKVAQKVTELVKEERRIQSRVGTRKLYKTLAPRFSDLGLKVGRDTLFSILREEDLLVKRKKSSCRTTDSYHHLHKYKNKIKAMQITRPNQVWVSDITYIRTIKGFCYLALITDQYSRKIVGYDISDSLELVGCLRALKMAIKMCKPVKGLIHHSDRGGQYCSKVYVSHLKTRGFDLSMTEENHCYENAIAERVNGILKDEFYLDQCFTTTFLAKKAAKSAIKVYNNRRLHLSLDYRTPEEVYEIGQLQTN